MAYDEALAERIRVELAGVDGASERKMFGGICFMINGNMACGVIGDELMARVGDAYAALLGEPHARPMDFTGRPMKGMLYVAREGVEAQADLRRWVARTAERAAALPSKYAAPRPSGRRSPKAAPATPAPKKAAPAKAARAKAAPSSSAPKKKAPKKRAAAQ